ALLSLTPSIHAQPAPAAAGQPVEAAPTPPAPPTPPTITVDDPLLTPIPAAPKVLTTWEEAIHLVDTRSTDMRIAEEDVARAEAQSRQALGRILPTLSANASAGRQSSTTDQPANSTLFGRTIPQAFTQTNSSTTTSFGTTLSIPILQPRGWYAYGTAKQSVDMVKLSTNDRRRLLITNVAAAIVTTFTAERVAEINRVGMKTALERLELTRRRARLGTATRLDVVRAEQDVTSATNTIIQGNEALRKAREALGLALGEDVPYSVAPSISLNAIENSVRSMCRIGKPEERADVQAAQRQLEINRRQVNETRLGFLPTASIDGTLSTGTSSQSVDYSIAGLPQQQQPTNRNYVWSIRAVISIPLFEGTRYGELALNRATRDQQGVRVEALTRQARLDVTQANRSVEVAEQSRANSETARDLAKETSRLSQVAFEAGTATSFELIDAAGRLRTAEQDLVVKEFELVRAKIAALLAAAVCEE
ncbi:MAG TPA: TolC family protein, partial [Polyangium sp.]|nr:TolC family protein [Polyangium sp.]